MLAALTGKWGLLSRLSPRSSPSGGGGSRCRSRWPSQTARAGGRRRSPGPSGQSPRSWRSSPSRRLATAAAAELAAEHQPDERREAWNDDCWGDNPRYFGGWASSSSSWDTGCWGQGYGDARQRGRSDWASDSGTWNRPRRWGWIED